MTTVRIGPVGGHLRRLVFCLLAVACAVPTAGCSRSGDGSGTGSGPAFGARPGILLIGLDTLRGDHLHCAGLDWLRTPHIDALAADGVYFPDCLATAPWTGPSFASIYTGLLPYHHGYLGGTHGRLADEHRTMAEILREAGWRTAAFVTISFLTEVYGMAQGFEEGDKFTDGGQGEEAELVTARGLEYARQHAAEPFFLLLHYYDVHAPYTPPAPFDRMYYEGDPFGPGTPLLEFLESDANKVPERRGEIYRWLEGVTDPAYPAAQYAAGVSHVDHHVGRVLDGLKELGLYDDMLIILVSDHGEHLGEHDIYFTHSLPFQETLRVPLILKLPGNRRGGTRVGEMVSTLDILPTVLRALDLAVPDGLDGTGLLDLVEGRPPVRGPRTLFAEQGSEELVFCKVAVREPWKLMVFRVREREFPLLYDLGADPGELRDVARDRPEVAARLTEALWRRFDRARPLTVAEALLPRGLTEEAKRKLRALGYVH